ncbi:DUF2796 domain-containing protein [Rhodobacteraceae bacterium B1Z28]|uniref:DUF2796 domain-containing protein n=1 Tax=Ruegeria haliotis TaxID=2747601 RepID=A0ABX2PKF6_9RHOB|nr:DUF2796 domain-containing protein [Ruegeria haliotis]NVO54260.1 DUF2796 domain-containing protein [Ruegeria haliotis]
MKCVVLALSLCPAALAAQDSQLETPHQHGVGTLGITFSGAEFTLSLVVPGIDIIGFERPAANDDDRAMVAIAISDLSKPLELFIVPTEAGCFTASANVTLTSESSEETPETGEQTSTHSEFQADYAIQCQDMEALDTIEFAYFDRFESTDKLKVQVELAGLMHKFDVTRATPLLDMSGLQ